MNDKYRVYGIWSCQSRKCKHEWESLYTAERFREYLREAERHIWRKCWACNSRCQFSSIELYEKQQVSKESDVTQIVNQLNLTVDNKYLVYGHWLCQNWKCRHNSKCMDRWICQDKWQYQNRWKCQHNRPRCQSGEQCRKRMCICHQLRQHNQYRPLYLPHYHEQQCQNKWMKRNEWKCKHNPTCGNEWECKREYKCRYEWQEEYTQEKLKEYQPVEEDEFFRRLCKNCNQKSMVSSFRLYMQQPKDINERPAIEIICRLEWNNHYRVFGNWKCCDCIESWPSAFTWISLRKFIDEVSGKNLNPTDFYMQGCNKCENPENKILEYTPLEQGKKRKPHIRGLCIRCLYYDSC